MEMSLARDDFVSGLVGLKGFALIDHYIARFVNILKICQFIILTRVYEVRTKIAKPLINQLNSNCGGRLKSK